MMESTGGGNLSRLKVIVKHLGDLWPAVLHRRTYARAMGSRADLRDCLEHTYAAHVHNALQDVLLIDLIREIGALVLDTDRRSASVANVVAQLRDPKLLQELEAEYRVVPPLAVQLHNEKDLDPATIAAIRDSIQRDELRRNLEQLASLPTTLNEIENALLVSDTAKALSLVRNKAVAHYDVVRDGSDWRMWRIDGVGLTYGQVDAYVEAATSAIDNLSHFVRHSAFDFEGSREIGEERIREYIDALVIGLGTQRNEREAKRAKVQRGMEILENQAADRSGGGPK